MARTGQTIAIVHREALIREALVTIAERIVPSECVTSHGTLEAFTHHLRADATTLILLDDVLVRSCVGDLSAVRQRLNGARVILFASHLVRDHVVKALVDGASGYVSQEMDATHITEAIHVVLRDGSYIPPLPEPTAQPIMESAPRAANDLRLTARQRDVLALMKLGKSNKEIARELAISESTVKVHVAAIFQSLHVRNRLSAIIWSQEKVATSRIVSLSA